MRTVPLVLALPSLTLLLPQAPAQGLMTISQSFESPSFARLSPDGERVAYFNNGNQIIVRRATPAATLLQTFGTNPQDFMWVKTTPNGVSQVVYTQQFAGVTGTSIAVAGGAGISTNSNASVGFLTQNPCGDTLMVVWIEPTLFRLEVMRGIVNPVRTTLLTTPLNQPITAMDVDPGRAFGLYYVSQASATLVQRIDLNTPNPPVTIVTLPAGASPRGGFLDNEREIYVASGGSLQVFSVTAGGAVTSVTLNNATYDALTVASAQPTHLTSATFQPKRFIATVHNGNDIRLSTRVRSGLDTLSAAEGMPTGSVWDVSLSGIDDSSTPFVYPVVSFRRGGVVYARVLDRELETTVTNDNVTFTVTVNARFDPATELQFLVGSTSTAFGSSLGGTFNYVLPLASVMTLSVNQAQTVLPTPFNPAFVGSELAYQSVRFLVAAPVLSGTLTFPSIVRFY